MTFTMDFSDSDDDGSNTDCGKKADVAATGGKDDDIACEYNTPGGRRPKHLSADGIAFTAVINVEDDDL